eukprot:366182-Chlamydomonas_euryale.AAC.15
MAAVMLVWLPAICLLWRPLWPCSNARMLGLGKPLHETGTAIFASNAYASTTVPHMIDDVRLHEPQAGSCIFAAGCDRGANPSPTNRRSWSLANGPRCHSSGSEKATTGPTTMCLSVGSISISPWRACPRADAGWPVAPCLCGVSAGASSGLGGPCRASCAQTTSRYRNG